MNADRVQAWLAGCAQQSAALMGSGGRRLAAQGAAAADAAAGGAAEGAAAGPPDLRSNAIFSHFEYEDPCQPGAIISAPIEPLVGHFRCGALRWLCVMRGWQVLQALQVMLRCMQATTLDMRAC